MERELGLRFYRAMVTIRSFEERALQLYSRGLVRGSTHVSIGQEAVAVGICSTLDASRGDCITSHHRGHGHFIVMGGDVKVMMAEILGRATGYCKGKGGSMHIADKKVGAYGANGIVGGGIAMGCGLALGAKLLGEEGVSVTFFGDGALNQGVLYESLNLASIWDLPVVFVCENNLYAQTTPASYALAGASAAKRAAGFNIEGVEVDGNDVEAVYGAARRAVEKARSENRPTFIEARTYRWKGHWQADPEVYRTKAEVQSWMTKCPIAALAEKLREECAVGQEELQAITGEVGVLIDQAEEFALSSSEPDVSALLEGLYV